MTSESKPVRGNTWNKRRSRLAVVDHRYDQIGFRISQGNLSCHERSPMAAQPSLIDRDPTRH